MKCSGDDDHHYGDDDKDDHYDHHYDHDIVGDCDDHDDDYDYEVTDDADNDHHQQCYHRHYVMIMTIRRLDGKVGWLATAVPSQCPVTPRWNCNHNLTLSL